MPLSDVYYSYFDICNPFFSSTLFKTYMEVDSIVGYEWAIIDGLTLDNGIF